MHLAVTMAALAPAALLGCEGALITREARDTGAGLDAFGSALDSAITPHDAALDAPGLVLDAVTPPVDSGAPPPFDAGPCGVGDLASRLTVTPVPGLAARGPLYGAALAGGGVVAAFGSGANTTIQALGGDGSVFGAPITVEGGELWGFATSPDAHAVIVARGTDALYLVGVGHDGAPRFSQRLLGEVPHDVMGNEWFGALIRYGRLDYTGTEWAAYYTVNRLWPDGIAHYGDQLRLFTTAGAPASTRWDWGCSHSMEVRITHNAARLAPVCASDCYPSKGVHFDHRTARLYTDESGSNCAGGYGTSLGGVVPMADGFWVTFTATDGRASPDVALVHVSNDGGADAPIWITTDAAHDGDVHAARLGAGFVVAWSGGGVDRIARFDAGGAMQEGPLTLTGAGLSGASDFFVIEGGDVGWFTSVAGSLAFARLRACE